MRPSVITFCVGVGEPAMNRIVIIGGGPAGYEAALVATQLVPR